MRAKALSAPTAEFLLEKPAPAVHLLSSGEDAADISDVFAAEQDARPPASMAETQSNAPAGTPELVRGRIDERLRRFQIQ